MVFGKNTVEYVKVCVVQSAQKVLAFLYKMLLFWPDESVYTKCYKGGFFNVTFCSSKK